MKAEVKTSGTMRRDIIRGMTRVLVVVVVVVVVLLLLLILIL
jgi:hypothetical protein